VCIEEGLMWCEKLEEMEKKGQLKEKNVFGRVRGNSSKQ
jgi:hypothetical protein